MNTMNNLNTQILQKNDVNPNNSNFGNNRSPNKSPNHLTLINQGSNNNSNINGVCAINNNLNSLNLNVSL